MLAVAGSGKTSYIIDKLNLESNVLIVTYTDNNVENIRRSITKKWGYFPPNIKLLSFYSFLYSFCFKPFLLLEYRVKGIDYENYPGRFAKDDHQFISSSRRLYHHRISKFVSAKGVMDDIRNRLAKYYTSFFVDEVQDFAGHDFNLLEQLVKANVNVLLVGDFYQHTFDTSRDGTTNGTLHNNYEEYRARFEKMGLFYDNTTLMRSYRCSPTVCNYVSEKLGVKMESHQELDTKITFISESQDVERIVADNSIIKLFYMQHRDFNCYSQNWGASKGVEYDTVCVVLNKTTLEKFNAGRLIDLAPSSKNKFYVACTRTKGDLYFVAEEMLSKDVVERAVAKQPLARPKVVGKVKAVRKK